LRPHMKSPAHDSIYLHTHLSKSQAKNPEPTQISIRGFPAFILEIR
jgi:hypothetical protein